MDIGAGHCGPYVRKLEAIMVDKAVLIIGEDPALIDFDAPDAPKGMSPEKVMAGLDGSAERLTAAGYRADLLLTSAGPVSTQVVHALSRVRYDVIVVGAGLRILPATAERFEQIMNALHENAPHARFAFNSKPDDSDIAALRWL